jgi:hypothetical protein
VSGGCQDIYTVIPNSTVTAVTCPNVTASAPLDVNALVVTGAFSQYGWPPQVRSAETCFRSLCC